MRSTLGNHGEELAARHLADKGYTILERNWRAGRTGEIDIIASDTTAQSETTLVFVEVKTRTSQRYGAPAEALTPVKQARMLTLAEAFLQAHPHMTYDAIRFDVVAILVGRGHTPPQLTHLPNAFDGG